MLMVKRRVVYTKSAVLSSPINKVLDLRKCVDCLQNYTRMYGCYLMQCVLYRVISGSYTISDQSLLLSTIVLNDDMFKLVYS